MRLTQHNTALVNQDDITLLFWEVDVSTVDRRPHRPVFEVSRSTVAGREMRGHGFKFPDRSTLFRLETYGLSLPAAKLNISQSNECSCGIARLCRWRIAIEKSDALASPGPHTENGAMAVRRCGLRSNVHHGGLVRCGFQFFSRCGVVSFSSDGALNSLQFLDRAHLYCEA